MNGTGKIIVTENEMRERRTDDEVLRQAGWRWRRVERSDYKVEALACIALETAGFNNLFSTRAGGISSMPHEALNLAGFNEDEAANIYENRRRFLSLLDASDSSDASNETAATNDNQAWRLATVFQTHSANVHRFTHDKHDDDVRADALTLDARKFRQTLIAVKTADCVPVLIGDARTGAAAAVHAGWRGTLGQIVARTVDAMIHDYDARPSDFIVAIGAAALACCYEVGSEVIEGFTHQQGSEAASLFKPTRDKHALIDLHEANRRELIKCGVKEANIYLAPFCTMHDNDLFFSYRKEKQLYGRVGRLMACIGGKGESRKPQVES